MKILISVLTIAAFINLSFTHPAPSNDEPAVKWDKTTHDFGKIQHKKPVKAVFLFTNQTTHPIIIIQVEPTCGCTAPKYDEHPILPGQQGKIEVTYDAMSRGVFHKKIIVKMDVGNFSVFVKGQVID